MSDINTNENYNGITEGVIWKQILSFFFPILFGTLFQQLYNTVDAVVVGRILGKEALAAVGGGTGTAINLIIGFFTGLSSGATVIISQCFGAKDEQNVKKAIHNACAIALWGGIVISVLGYFTSGALLRAIDTPADVYDLALSYMKIYFGGGVVVVMYNIGAGIFRAFGDSRRPLYFLIAGCVVNIFLDILFVSVLKTGVEGAAYATVISQLISLVLVVFCLRRRTDCCKLIYKDVRFDSVMLKKTVSIGFPAGLQSVLYTISNLIIAANINAFGTDTAAAWAAYGKIDCIFWMIISAFGIAITTFVGQNFGAGKIERAKKGIRVCIFMAAVATVLVEAAFVLFGRQFYRLFASDEQVIEVGMQVLMSIAPYFFTYILVEVLSGAIRGVGKTLIPTLITLIGICGFRIIWLQIVPRFTSSLSFVVFCYPISWTLASILFVIYYYKGKIFK